MWWQYCYSVMYCFRRGGRTSVSLVMSSQILLLTLLLLFRTPVSHSCEYGAPISGPPECVTFTPEDLSDVKTTYSVADSNAKHYYRYLRLYKDYLLVGARNSLLTLSKDNISVQIHNHVDPPRGDYFVENCNGWGIKVEPDCQNHIRYITVNESYNSGDVVYVCGTGGYNPTGYLYNITSNTKVQSFPETLGNAKAKCPYDPFDNTTAIYVVNGNPDDRPALYSAANADYTKSLPMIYRSSLYYDNGTEAFQYLQTAKKDNNWLNEPQFVGSFEMGEVVYFFFREESLEHSSCGKKVYSRVARVCKNDRGGPSVVRNQWTSFQKARLNCSIPGKVQYYFDEIQDIRLDEEKETFYALFTTSSYGVTGSAICAFTQASIEAAFNGLYSKMMDGRWVEVLQFEEPENSPRPGDCSSIPDSRTLNNAFLTFIKEKTLMYDAVQHMFAEPLYVKPNALLQKLEAHFGESENVFFAGSNDGQVYQIYQPTPQRVDTLLSSVMSPLLNSGAVWSLQYSSEKKMLYVGYDTAIVQLDLEKLCCKYDMADSCVFNPFCAWFNKKCYKKSDSSNVSLTYCKLAQNLTNPGSRTPQNIWESLLNMHISAEKPVQTYINTGGIVTLEVRMRLCLSGTVHWYYGQTCADNMQKVSKKDSQYLFGVDNSLTIRDAKISNAGCYKVTGIKDDKEQDLAYYTLTVQINETQTEDLWTRKFYEWCDEFEDYKNRINVWKDSCTEPSNRIDNAG